MKSLNNQQLILLAVLVSFITSTATGIFTVALLSEAPQSATNVINKIVERTVQVVTQPAVERVIEKKDEKVVEQGSQLVEDVVKKGTPSIVTLVIKKSEMAGNEELADEGIFIRKGAGVIVESSGKILTLSSVVDQKVPYYLLDESGTSTSILIPLTLEKSDSGIGLAQFKVSSSKPETYQAMTVSKKAISIGQTAVVWGSRGVSVSFISSVLDEKGISLYRIYVDSTDPLPGRIVSNLDGELIGLLRANNTLIPATVIATFLIEETAHAGA